ncbi:DUF4386 domain-containing protein [Roseibium sp.]|uniref:DUF4386 domain-containing protein n=1 Tax=Roseibium sp. TaxID=1936156 RepID=UPI003A97EF72
MTNSDFPPTSGPVSGGRFAGVLYLVIIACGIGSEVFLRGPLMAAGGLPSVSPAEIASSLRWSLAADTIMVLADVALALVLFQLLKPVNTAAAMAAMVFRLVQAAILGANLLSQHMAVLILEGAGLQGIGPGAPARMWLELHGAGYDMGLFFFGINCLITGYLLFISGWLPKIFGIGLIAAGLVYLTGSTLRVLAPGLSDDFAVAYAIPLAAELAFAVWLVVMGFGPKRKNAERRT